MLPEALARALRRLDAHPEIVRIVLRCGPPDVHVHMCTLVPDHARRTLRVDYSGTRRRALAADVAAMLRAGQLETGQQAWTLAEAAGES
ncbi:hypothetical protein [Nonomuraea sp. CA-141351]|uniref:hypothetical protein n=1 Tax=Nonomuraea sp. CA-141351 TaxID=3239996 RepID=UPI003D940FA7